MPGGDLGKERAYPRDGTALVPERMPPADAVRHRSQLPGRQCAPLPTLLTQLPDQTFLVITSSLTTLCSKPFAPKPVNVSTANAAADPAVLFQAHMQPELEADLEGTMATMVSELRGCVTSMPPT